MSIQTELQKSIIGAIVELYELDLSRFGEGTLYFTPMSVNGTSIVSFGGQAYQPFPIQSKGWSMTVDGAPPRPTLMIANITGALLPYLTDYNNLVGAKVTRKLTTDKFLDSGATPDATQILATNKYVIQQMKRMNKYSIEFILSSLMDQPNLKLPRGLVLRTEFPAAGLYRKGDR